MTRRKPLEVRKTGVGQWAAYRDGERVARAGVTTIWEGRGYCWFENEGLTVRELVGLTPLIKQYLDDSFRPMYRRLEAVVYEDHEEGHRWARRLGFQPEHVCEKLMPNGEPGWIYVMFGE